MEKDYRKKACERYQSLSKEEKKKSDNVVMKDIKSRRRLKTKPD